MALMVEARRLASSTWWKKHFVTISIFVLVLVVTVTATFLCAKAGISWGIIGLAYLAAAVGAGVGATELVSRYRDAPGTVVGGIPGLLYMALNAAASLAAFVVIRLMNWRFGIDSSSGDSAALRATQFLVAAFGAAALFRTSLFTVKAGEQDIGIGPSAVLTVALSTADRAVDRKRALSRGSQVRQVMQNVDFTRAAVNLVPYCFQVALQNVSPEEQTAVSTLVKSLQADTTGLAAHIKSMVLGASLMSVVGYDVLYYAVSDLCDDIKLAGKDECIPGD